MSGAVPDGNLQRGIMSLSVLNFYTKGSPDC